MQQFSQSLPMMLYAALDAVMPRFRLIFKDFGLTEQQWRVLRVLWERERVSFGELADITLISAPSLVGVVDRVEAMGLVSRARSEEDRRVVFVVITDAGRDLEDRVMPRVDAAYAALQASVEPGTWTAVLRGLADIAASDPAAIDTDQSAAAS